MKILVITDLYPINENEKYTPKTIFNFVKEWEKSGHEVKIIKPNFILNSFLRKKPFYKTGVYKNIENINYFLPFLGNIKNKVKTKFDPDVVIAHMPSGLIFANKFGHDFCAAVHCSDIEVLTNPVYGFYFKTELEKAYKNAAKIACRSYVLKNKFLKLYPEFESKTFVAPSGVDFEPIRREWTKKDKIKVLTCGQFIKRKNIDKVINACKDLENVELTVIGSGKEESALKKLLSEKPHPLTPSLKGRGKENSTCATFTSLIKGRGKIRFLGQISRDEVLQKMRESDIFILPSVNETFGMVYLEAMASGCITVCTENDGIDGIIKDGENGFLTGTGVNDIIETLRKIINIDDKQNILNNTYNTVLCYIDKHMADKYIENILE